MQGAVRIELQNKGLAFGGGLQLQSDAFGGQLDILHGCNHLGFDGVGLLTHLTVVHRHVQAACGVLRNRGAVRHIQHQRIVDEPPLAVHQRLLIVGPAGAQGAVGIE